MSGRAQLLVFLLAFTAFAYSFDKEPGTNALAHYDQAVAIAARGELSIDGVLFLQEKDESGKTSLYAYTMDWSRVPDGARGAYYPAKSPGLSLIEAPPLIAIAAIETACGVDPLARRAFERNEQALTWLLGALPAALVVLLLVKLSLALGASPRDAVLGALAVSIATTWAPFASVLYAHVPTGVALALASHCALAGDLTRRRAALAGALAGLAVALTYTAALALPFLFAIVVKRAARADRVFAFITAGVPFVILLMIYHGVAFGSPFRTAYDFQNPLYGGGRGVSYLTTLEPGAALGRLYQLTIGPYRGLFFYSPVLIPAIVCAFLELRNDNKERKLGAVLALGTLGSLLLITALHHGWWGGFSTGPRYLVPAIPLLAPFAARAFERWPGATTTLAVLSLVNALAVTWVSVSVEEHVENPLVQAIYPGLIHGQLGRTNLGLWLGLPPLASIGLHLVLLGTLAMLLFREIRPNSKLQSGPSPMVN